MRLLFVTRWEQIEGDYEYARNLVENLRLFQKDIEVQIYVAPFNWGDLRRFAEDFDVIHFNFVFGTFDILTVPGNIRSFGSNKVVLTFHENNRGDSKHSHPFLTECGVVVSHEKNPHGFVHIPQGIPVMSNPTWSPANTTIGTAGFPFGDKRIPDIARAARILIDRGTRITGCSIHAPDTAHANTWAVREEVLAAVPNARYETPWWPQESILDLLSTNLVNVYAANSRRLGPSGSVRIGLATGSHIVVSRSGMFRDLEEYEDEVEWIDGSSEDVTPYKIADAVERVMANGKRPKRILQDGSWQRSAELYADVYRSLKR